MSITPPPRRIPEKILADAELRAYFKSLDSFFSSIYEGVSGNNSIRTHLMGDRLFSGNPALAISSNFDVSVNAVVVAIDGALASIGAGVCDTGTTATFPSGKWGVFLVSTDSAGTFTATWDTNGSNGYDDEEQAKNALPDAPDSEAPIGYVTVQAHASNSFTAGTDALQGGTGGNPSQDTNYYNQADAGRLLARALG